MKLNEAALRHALRVANHPSATPKSRFVASRELRIQDYQEEGICKPLWIPGTPNIPGSGSAEGPPAEPEAEVNYMYGDSIAPLNGALGRQYTTLPRCSRLLGGISTVNFFNWPRGIRALACTGAGHVRDVGLTSRRSWR